MTSNSNSEFCIVLSTCADPAQAERVARALVEAELAACVNFLPNTHSVYRWKGKVESAAEILLIIKTARRHLEELERVLSGLHSYEVPEFLVLEISGGSVPYLEWLGASLK